jgi:hypothetical protein
MGIWNHYIVTDQKAVRVEDAERALQAVNPDFYIDGDIIVLRNAYGDDLTEELECGQISVQEVADPHLLENRKFFEEQFEGKQSRERLGAVLNSARSLVTVQLVNTDFWWDNEPERTLRPLQDWLIENFEGLLRVEGGDVYDRQGLVP